MEKTELTTKINDYFEEYAVEKVQNEIDFDKEFELNQNQRLYDNGWL